MLNQCTLIGRFVRAPELRRTQTGKAVLNFDLAVDRDVESCGVRTDFPSFIAWGEIAENIARFFTKGRQICVTGRLESEKWTAKDSSQRTSWKINVRQFFFVDKKPQAGGAVDVNPDADFDPDAVLAAIEDDDADLPFG